MNEPRRSIASGKVILFGEHAVVHGVMAIAAGIDRGAWATATTESGDVSSLFVRGWNVAVREDEGRTADGPPLARALADLLTRTRQAQDQARTPLTGTRAIVAEADLPPGGGLGCSAALGVAVARALDPQASPSEIARRVDAWERVFHGNPSGVDAAVAAMGGCVSFQKGADPPIRRVTVGAPLTLCVGMTGIGSSTKSMVDAVARLAERRPGVVGKTFDAIGTLAQNARFALEVGDRRAIGQLLDLNQMLLSGLFVSTTEIEQMCATARENGALGAKLTGAGGGGCVVALVDNEAAAERVLRAWKNDGFDGFVTRVGTNSEILSAYPGATVQAEAP